MIKVSTINGVVLLKICGKLDKNSYIELSDEINYLLYDVGVNYYIFDFTNISYYERDILSLIENKVVEIFLNCGRIIMCGLEELIGKKIKNHDNRLFYVNNEFDAVKYSRL